MQGGLGYPRECSYTRLIERSGNGFHSPNFDEDAWLVEKAIQSLPDSLKDTVQVFYLRVGTIEQMAKELHCHRVTIYARIDVAHSKIMDWLNDEACGVRLL
jgi:DNA-directed RNA polymerase specialized sigma24 family protein